MNLWECDYRYPDGIRCRSKAIGCGGAIGLRAIGWWFKRGTMGPPDLLCPDHRPEPTPCRERPSDYVPCAPCAAELEANYLQTLIRERATGPAGDRHVFEGRLDRRCERCGLADRDPIHTSPWHAQTPVTEFEGMLRDALLRSLSECRSRGWSWDLADALGAILPLVRKLAEGDR